MADTTTVFNSADDYELFMGRWSRAIGERFLDWLAPTPGAGWLDVGCGTGAFSELITNRCAPRTLAGIDPSPEQIEYAREHFPRFRFEVADAAAIPFPDHSFDVVASALVLHFIPDRQAAFAEMLRVLASGGVVGGYTWKREGLKEFAAYGPVINGLAAIGVSPPHSIPVEESSVAGMVSSLEAAGFKDAEAIEIEVTQTYRNFEEYWRSQIVPFSRSGKAVLALDDTRRGRLREYLRDTLPAADGTITYPALAVAGKGRKG
jgi:SAM-dependent methyltransferase